MLECCQHCFSCRSRRSACQCYRPYATYFNKSVCMAVWSWLTKKPANSLLKTTWPRAWITGTMSCGLMSLRQGSQTRVPGANWGPQDDILWPPSWHQSLVLVRPARCSQTHIFDESCHSFINFFITYGLPWKVSWQLPAAFRGTVHVQKKHSCWRTVIIKIEKIG